MCTMFKKAKEKQKNVLPDKNEIINIHDKWDYIKPNIQALIASTEDYFVIIDKECMIDWETSPEFDIENIQHKDKINELKNCIFSLQCQPMDHHTEVVQYNYISMLGEALARVFDLDFESANLMIELARDYSNTRNVELSRIWILESSFFIIPILWLFIIVMSASAFYELIDIASFTSEIIMCSLVGGLSSILSLILRLSKLQYDFYAAHKSHIYECIAKTIVGVTSGALIYIMIKANIILPIINDLSYAHTLYYIFSAFVAGATERLIPSILSTYSLTKQEEK